jgi:hypothetical protein
MKLLAVSVIYLGVAACATDYVSQLSEPDYGRRSIHYTEGNVDPVLMMNGIYAAKQMSGFSAVQPSGAFCVNGYQCSPWAQQRGSSWDP